MVLTAVSVTGKPIDASARPRVSTVSSSAPGSPSSRACSTHVAIVCLSFRSILTEPQCISNNAVCDFVGGESNFIDSRFERRLRPRADASTRVDDGNFLQVNSGGFPPRIKNRVQTSG